MITCPPACQRKNIVDCERGGIVNGACRWLARGHWLLPRAAIGIFGIDPNGPCQPGRSPRCQPKSPSLRMQHAHAPRHQIAIIDGPRERSITEGVL